MDTTSSSKELSIRHPRPGINSNRKRRSIRISLTLTKAPLDDEVFTTVEKRGITFLPFHSTIDRIPCPTHKSASVSVREMIVIGDPERSLLLCNSCRILHVVKRVRRMAAAY